MRARKDVEAVANIEPQFSARSVANLTESKLLRLAQEGRKEAFDMLVVEYQPKMYSWASKMSRTLNLHQSEVPDVVQESLLKAWLNISKFRGDSKLSTWLYTITRHQAINQSKKNQRYQKTYNISDLETQRYDSDGGEALRIDHLSIDRDTPDEILIAKEVQRKVMDIIENLPLSLKNIIILREIEQMSYEEISNHTGSKLGTVKTQIHRARERIDRELKQWALGNTQVEDK